MSESGLPKRDTHKTLAMLCATDEGEESSLDEAWLRKSGGYGGPKESEYKSEGDLLQRVSSLCLGDGVDLMGVHVVNESERLCLPMESPAWSVGSIVGDEATPRICLGWSNDMSKIRAVRKCSLRF